MRGYWNSEKAQNWTGALVLIIVGALCLYLIYEPGEPWSFSLALTAALVIAQILTFLAFTSEWAAAKRERYLTLFWLEAAFIVPLYFLTEAPFIAIMGIVWMVQATELFSIRLSAWLLFASSATFAASQFYHWLDRDLTGAITNSLTLALFHLFAVIATHRANREQQLREETAAMNRELLATRELLSQSSRQSERLRIARDLHDLLGHHMTALILNLEVASHNAEGKTREQVEQAQALGKLLLSDLRTAVNELREDDSIDFKQSVEKMVAGIPGLETSLDFSGAPAVRNMGSAETLLRCIQEALTNVLRHSGATHCRITLTELYNDFFLTVKDNGRCRGEVIPGNGLRGMLERAEEAGGEVSWRREADGFLLQLRLPAGDVA